MTAPARAPCTLDASGPAVFPIALGCMGMSGMYGPSDERESIATLHAALDAGVTLLDTGDFYGMGHNELLIGRALRDRRHAALLSVKFGAMRAPGGAWGGVDARPVAVRNFLAYTVTRLGVDHVDVYRPARLDVVPVIGARTRAQLADALGALAVRLSPADLARIEAAVPAEAVAGTRHGADQMQHLDSER
ncbi:MAG: aldo/keto reductase [Anaeromyxobacteraceae bacterium]